MNQVETCMITLAIYVKTFCDTMSELQITIQLELLIVSSVPHACLQSTLVVTSNRTINSSNHWSSITWKGIK